LFTLFGPTAYGRENRSFYRLKPVILDTKDRGQLTVTFGISSCGGNFLGLVFLPQPETRTLRVAAVEQTRSKICMGFERSQTLTFPALFASGSTVESISRFQSQRLVKFLNVQQIRLVTPEKTLSARLSVPELEVAYEATCAKLKPIGLFMSPVSSSWTALGLLSLDSAAKKSSSSCRNSTQIFKFPAAPQLQSLQIAVYSPVPPKLEQAYRIKKVPIVPGSLRVSQKKVTLKYWRRCHEVAVGLSLRSHKGRDDKSAMVVGMVVAQLYNDPCLHSSKTRKARIMSRYQLSRLVFNPADLKSPLLQIEKLPNTQPSRSFYITRPTQFHVYKSADLKFGVSYLDDCENNDALVIADFGPEGALIGVLQSGYPAQCRTSIKEAKLNMEHIGLAPSITLKPLTLNKVI
jgi:hypothetical protein